MIEITKSMTETYLIVGRDGHIKVAEPNDNLLPGDVIIETLGGKTLPPKANLVDAVREMGSDSATSLVNVLNDLLSDLETGEKKQGAVDVGLEVVGSSLGLLSTIEASGLEILASTFFETAGLTPEQSKALFHFVLTSQYKVGDIEIMSSPDGRGSVEEDVTVKTSGKLSLTEEDLFQPQIGMTDENWGTFSIDKSGNWSYELNNDHVDVQALSETSEPIVRNFTVLSEDGTSHEVVITIIGSDDLPIVHGTFSGAVTEGNIGDTATATGTVSISDVDNEDDPTFKDTTVVGDYGSLMLVDGIWTYILDQNKVQHLYEGEKVQDSITLTASDGTRRDILIDITGTDDVPVSSPVQGFAKVDDLPINKVTIVFDQSNSMTLTFDNELTVGADATAPKVESRAYKAAVALHTMVEQMIAEGGQSNTFIRLIRFDGDTSTESWLSLDDVEYITRPPELNGREPDDSSYLSDVASYTARWYNDYGINTDYDKALEAVMAPSDTYTSFPWQDGLDEDGNFNWDLYLNEQPVESKDTIFFISDGEPNPKEGEITSPDFGQRWGEYLQANDAKVYAIGIALQNNDNASAALNEISDEVVFIDSGNDLSQFLSRSSPDSITGGLLENSLDVDGDALTISVVEEDFTLLSTHLHDITITDPIVSSTSEVDGELHIETLFGNLEVRLNGSYTFTQSDTHILTGTQQADLHFLYKVTDGKNIIDNIFTLTLSENGTDIAATERNPLIGDDGINYLLGGDSIDIMLGQGGDDTLDGGTGDDILVGGLGDDVLTGGLGNDILTGGEGNDTFVFVDLPLVSTLDLDVITDFHLDEDTLDLRDILSPPSEGELDYLLAHIGASFDEAADNLNLTIEADSGRVNKVALEHFDMSKLDLVASAPSTDIVEQLFQHHVFQLN